MTAVLDVVLLHAFPLWSALYDDVRDLLAGTCRLHTPDLPGFGTAPLAPGEPSLDRSADAVVGYLDAAGVARAVVGGTSMGGYVAMALLRRYPERVSGLVLVDTKAGADPVPARANRERIAATVLADASTDVVLAEVVPMLLGETTVRTRPAVVDRVRSWAAAARPEAVAWAQRAMAARPDSFAVLRSADVPALVVVGAEDRLSSVDDAQAMADALPQGRLVVLEGAGHLTPVEVPDAFAGALTAHLASWR